jgi:hypothetical protein
MAEIDYTLTIEELRTKCQQQEVVIDTLRALLFTGWSLTNAYECEGPGPE